MSRTITITNTTAIKSSSKNDVKLDREDMTAKLELMDHAT